MDHCCCSTALKFGELYYGDELCPRQQLRKTEFYNDFLVHFDTHFLCGIETLRTNTQLETISLFQGLNDPPPDKDKMDLIRLVIPHLQAALQTRQRLIAADTDKQEFEQALNCLEQGIVLLDQSGSRIFVNAAAQRIVDRREGLSIVKSKFWMTSPSERASFTALVQRTCTNNEVVGNHGGAVHVSRHGKRPLNVSVRRFCCENPTAPRRAVAIVFISDPERQTRTRHF